jgi:hypothetical protein
VAFRDLHEGIAEEFASASGRGREWFDAEGYDTRRLPKISNKDIAPLKARLAQKKWRAEYPERARLLRRTAWIRRLEKEPDYRHKNYEHRKQVDPDLLAKANARAKALYRKKKYDPEWRAKRLVYQRAWNKRHRAEHLEEERARVRAYFRKRYAESAEFRAQRVAQAKRWKAKKQSERTRKAA